MRVRIGKVKVLSHEPRQNGWHGRTGDASYRDEHEGKSSGQIKRRRERVHDGLDAAGAAGPRIMVRS
jgi:hypothetical protein